MTITLSVFTIIWIVCPLGWLILAFWIGGDKSQGYPFDLVTSFLHILNFAGWLILGLLLSLYFK